MNQPPFFLIPPMIPSFPSVPILSNENCTDSSEWTDSDGNDCSFYQRVEFNCIENGADVHCCLSCSNKIGQNQLPWEFTTTILVADSGPSPGKGEINQEISSQPSSQDSSQDARINDTNFIIRFLPKASIMTLAIIQTISSLLSLIASIAVICMIARSHAKISTVFHRLLLGLCIADIVLSLSLAFSTAPLYGMHRGR